LAPIAAETAGTIACNSVNDPGIDGQQADHMITEVRDVYLSRELKISILWTSRRIAKVVIMVHTRCGSPSIREIAFLSPNSTS
jgi:hypothetical protein